MWLAVSVAIGTGLLAWSLALLRSQGRLRQALRQSGARFEAFVGELPIGVLVHGPKTQILDCNRAAVDLFGIPEAKLRGKTCFDVAWDVVHEDGSSVAGHDHPVAQAVATRRATRGVVLGVQRPASWDRVWLLANALPQLAADGSVERVVCTYVDITARKHLEEQILDQGLRDPLTGCFNRRYLPEFERRVEMGQKQWGCLVVDVAGLKDYNERHGHHAGDDLLVQMSRFLMLQVRAGEAVVRLGGDDFLVLLTGVDPLTIEIVVQRILKEAMRRAPISFSMGWAAREGIEPLEKTVGRAETRLVTVPAGEREAPQRRSPLSAAPEQGAR